MEFEQEWLQVYFKTWRELLGVDSHQQFADLCGISREEAEEIHYNNLDQCSQEWLVETIQNIKPKNVEV